MMKLIGGVLLALLLSCSSGAKGCVLNPEPIDTWSTGYKLEYRITLQEDITSWTATLQFPTALQALEIWSANVISSDENRNYIIENLSWNGQKYAGDILVIDFIARFASEDEVDLPCLMTNFNGAVSPPITNPPTDPPTDSPTDPPTNPTTDSPTIPPTEGCLVNPNPVNVWNTGYQIQYHVTVQETVSSWSFTLEFPLSIQLLEIYSGDIASNIDNANMEYLIENKPWNGHLTAGSILLIDFIARFDHQDDVVLPCLTLNFNGAVDPPTTNPTNPPTNPPTDSPTDPTTNPTNPPTNSPTDLPTDPPTTPPVVDSTDYTFALDLSLRFFEAQRSGVLPANNRIPWRHDSAINDGGSAVDLTGGWYDAGDRMKFGLPMASSATMILYGLHFFQEGFEAAGQYEIGKDQVKWALDYFLKCHPPTSPDRFYVQVGNGHQDHSVWDRPESITEAREGYFVGAGASAQGGADVAGETAAALAAGSLVFQSSDPLYSMELLDAAKSLYELAVSPQLAGIYHGLVPGNGAFYPSFHYKDELAHAAAWLTLATGESGYQVDAEFYLSGLAGQSWAVDWGDKITLTHFLMYAITGESQYKTNIENYMNDWPLSTSTPEGLAFRSEWGSLRYTSNTVMLALLAASEGINPALYRGFAKDQIDYMLGLRENGNGGFSFLIGFGSNYPLKPHHRGASCPTDINTACTSEHYSSANPNPNELLGALVGGPDSSDNYNDDREDYRANEVATDYNAGFTSALAGVITFGL